MISLRPSLHSGKKTSVSPPPCSIDCAGILKLRNSDIELRKGETDIGRKNTRVRVVFRVHIPQPSGKVLSLQAASIPVECCECLPMPHTQVHMSPDRFRFTPSGRPWHMVGVQRACSPSQPSPSSALRSGAAAGGEVQPGQLPGQRGRRNGHQRLQLLPRIQGHLPGERPR